LFFRHVGSDDGWHDGSVCSADYARLGRQAAAEGTPFAATGWFAGGYFVVWIGFSLVATVAQWTLERSALLDVEMASASDALGGAILIAAGLPVDTAQGRLPYAMRVAASVPDAPRWLP
jgi:Predicted metal-binding integral membrane protein (DUF2182)